jgi:hypothetical protein
MSQHKEFLNPAEKSQALRRGFEGRLITFAVFLPFALGRRIEAVGN